MWPAACPGVDSPLLNPRELWSDREAYDKSHKNLAEKFKSNFEQFVDSCSQRSLSQVHRPQARVIRSTGTIVTADGIMVLWSRR